MGKPTGHRWVPLTKASDAELWCPLWYMPEQTLEKHSRSRWFETPSHRTGGKPFSELVMAGCTYIYLCTCHARTQWVHFYKSYPLTTRNAHVHHTFISGVCLSRYMLNPGKLLRFTSVQYLWNRYLIHVDETCRGQLKRVPSTVLPMSRHTPTHITQLINEPNQPIYYLSFLLIHFQPNKTHGRWGITWAFRLI